MQDPKTSPNTAIQAVQEEWIAYALSHSEEIPPLLKSLEKETHQKILQARMLSSPLQGRLLSLLSQMIQPKKILEIGTFTGYASLCLAEGLNHDGELHTIDSNEELVEIQQKYFTSSPYKNHIHSHLGNAIDLLTKLEGHLDLVFIDADKVNYEAYFEAILPKTRKGTLVISDNVLWSGKVLKPANSKDESTKALQLYNQKLKKDPRVKTVLLPIRYGLTLSWVL